MYASKIDLKVVRAAEPNQNFRHSIDFGLGALKIGVSLSSFHSLLTENFVTLISCVGF